MSDEQTVRNALLSASRAWEILDALARAVWFNSHSDGSDCPPDMIPTLAALTTWLPECPADAMKQARKRLEATTNQSHLEWDVLSDALVVVRSSEIDSVKFVMSLDGVHELWCDLAEVARPRHPLAPVVEAWQKRPVEIEPDRKETAILTGGLFAWAARHGRLPAPAVLYSPRNENDLPLQPGRIEPETQLCLTGMAPRESAVDLAPAIMLADAAGLGAMKSGSGARIDKRVLVYALLAIPQAERRSGGRYYWRPTLHELVQKLIWPAPAETGTGKGRRSLWRPLRHAAVLKRALNAVSQAGVILPDGSEWRPVMVRRLPNFGDLKSEILFEIALPDEAGHGPLIRRDALIAAGVVSDPAFDGTLALATLWDRAKAKNGGFRIYATRPKALRDSLGRLMLADGRIILGHAWNPIRGKEGQLRWHGGDKPQRNWQHPEAVIVGRERHPKADRVPVLDRDDRRRLFYGHASDNSSGGRRTQLADAAERRLETWEQQGRVVIERTAEGWRILEPWRNGATP